MACGCNDDALRDLEDGNGTSVEWSLDHTVQVDVVPKATSTLKLEATPGALSGTVSVTSGCDEQLHVTASGLSAGSKHYSVVGSRLADRYTTLPGPILVEAYFIGAPVTNKASTLFKSLYIDNPSTCRYARVLWTHHHWMPHLLANPGFSMWVDVQERLYGTGNPAIEGVWNTIDRIYYINDTNITSPTPVSRVLSPPSVSYHASGTIQPGASFQVDSQLVISGVTGSGTWQDIIRGRADALAVTTTI